MISTKIKKINIELFIILIVFGISLINERALFIALCISLILLTQKEIGLIKLMCLLILRTIISPGLFFDINSVNEFQIFKWIIIYGGSILMITLSFLRKTRMNSLIIYITVFFVYLMLISQFNTNNMQLAVFKIINYIVPLIGFYLNRNVIIKPNIHLWLSKVIQWSIFLSLPLYVTSLGFLRNGHGFQGIYNNPNMLGIIIVLSTALFLTSEYKYINKCIYTFINILCVFVTESRTALISILFILLVHILIVNKNIIYRIYVLIVTIFATIILYFVMDKKIIEFIYKGQESGNIFASRSGQIKLFVYSFEKSPFFGSGFGVPIRMNSTVLTDKTIVEAGNLIIALIMYSGLIGLGLFLLMFYKWITFSDINKIILILSTILISMGEMVLFSSNSIGLWCTLLWVLALNKEKGLQLEDSKIYSKEVKRYE